MCDHIILTSTLRNVRFIGYFRCLRICVRVIQDRLCAAEPRDRIVGIGAVEDCDAVVPRWNHGVSKLISLLYER